MQVTKLKSSNGLRSSFRVYDDYGLPFEEINCFLRYQEKRDYSPNTVKASAHDLICFFNYLKSIGKAWHEIVKTDLTDFIHFLRFDTGDDSLSALPVSGLTRSEASIGRMVSSVSSFYKYNFYSTGILLEPDNHGFSQDCYKSFLSFASKSSPHSLKRMPIQLLKRSKTIKRPKTVSDENLKKMVDMCTNRRDRLLILLLQETGMRIGQALQLKLRTQV